MEDHRFKELLEAQYKYDKRNSTNHEHPDDYEIAKALQEEYNLEESMGGSFAYSPKREKPVKESHVSHSWELPDSKSNIHHRDQHPEDYELAKALQEQFNHEESMENPRGNLVYTPKRKQPVKESTKSLVDASWELVDPTPNIHQLFVAFDKQFFWQTLQSVCVSWSKRMFSCAGICSYHGRGGLCSITLSEPLLKLRPRKDLIETLLHEMIHAYLFLTDGDRDRDGHGPKFHEHMYRINSDAGTNITVYHTFHDEVKLYKTHWWKCDGPCQHKHPFYGMVRRAMNRAPSKNDRWWDEHARTCGGTFIKVKEPEAKKPAKKTAEKENKKPQSAKAVENLPDIRKFFPIVSPNRSQPSTSQINNSPNETTLFQDKGNILSGTKRKHENPLTSPSQEKRVKKSSVNSLNFFNSSKENMLFQGKGNLLSGSIKKEKHENWTDAYSNVRNHWQNRFSASQSSSTNMSYVTCTNCNNQIGEVDFKAHLKTCANLPSSYECDICMEFIPTCDWNEHKANCLLNMSVTIDTSAQKECPLCFQIVCANLYDVHVAGCVRKGFDDLIAQVNELNEYLDWCLCDVFTDDNIREEFSHDMKDETKNAQDEIMAINDEDADNMVTCPSCPAKVPLDMINQHLDTCLC